MMGIIHESGQPRLAPDGSPSMIMAFFDAADATIVDNWDTLGMRGTGSHDIAVEDLFVPEGHVWHLAPIVHRREGAFAGPLYGIFPWLQIASLGPVGVGIGQAAVDALVEVATVKTPSYLSTPLREKEVAQANVAKAGLALVGFGQGLQASDQAVGDRSLGQTKPDRGPRVTGGHERSRPAPGGQSGTTPWERPSEQRTNPAATGTGERSASTPARPYESWQGRSVPVHWGFFCGSPIGIESVD